MDSPPISDNVDSRRAAGSQIVRLFLCCWIVYSVHFATNVVREHYPAFSLVKDGDFTLDEYYGLHTDIFVHRDGHAYINNNVATSVVAAAPLLVFNPLLDAIEARQKRWLRGHPDTEVGEYRTDKSLSKEFFRKVSQRGLSWRFGAATWVTSVFLMAPLSALFVVLFFQLLLERGVNGGHAFWLAVLFAFGTPLFFRTANLNHNMFVMYATFGAFLLLRSHVPRTPRDNSARCVLAGLCSGAALAFDYSGVVPLLALFGLTVLPHLNRTDWRTGAKRGMLFVLGSIPPVLFLLWSQWEMFGNPFLAAQHWMPSANYTERGWRGFSWPSLDLFALNLFHPAYGMFTFAPLLLLGFFPTRSYGRTARLVARVEVRFIFAFVLTFLTFCAANQYSRMQWNTGFRYLIVLVPFVYLLVCEHLRHLSFRVLLLVAVPVVAHSWVLSMVREPVPESWRRVVHEGLQLPWLTVLQRTSAPGNLWLHSPMVPVAIYSLLAGAVACCWLIRPFAGRASLQRAARDSCELPIQA